MEWLLYRNGSEAVEDGGGFVDKRSGSVAEMEQFGGGCTWFGRGEWGGSCVIVYICIGEAGRWKGEMSSI